jgi:hypothetical protein
MIRSYSELQTSVANWLARGDLAATIPEFIQLAEAEIGRRVRRRVIRTTMTLTGAATPLPADCAELRSIKPMTGAPWRDHPLRGGTKEMLDEAAAHYAGVPGEPRVFAVVGDELLVTPAPAGPRTFEVVYYERLTPLSAANGSNAVLVEAPDIYLWGALAQAAPFLQHDERLPIFQGKFDAAVAQLDAAREREESAASFRPARLPVVF